MPIAEMQYIAEIKMRTRTIVPYCLNASLSHLATSDISYISHTSFLLAIK